MSLVLCKETETNANFDYKFDDKNMFNYVITNR